MSVVVQSGDFWFLGYRDDGGDLEAAGYLTELERRSEDGGEDSGQLVCAVLQGGGRHSVRTSSLAAVLLPEEPPYFALLHDEGRWKGGDRVGKL